MESHIDQMVAAIMRHASSKTQMKDALWTLAKAKGSEEQQPSEGSGSELYREVTDRLEAARPALTAETSGHDPHPEQKLRRNVALHPNRRAAAKVTGQEILRADGKQLRKWQRQRQLEVHDISDKPALDGELAEYCSSAR